ncbi:MAG: vWA domain-containing protein [Ardenticatenales bacterium]
MMNASKHAARLIGIAMAGWFVIAAVVPLRDTRGAQPVRAQEPLQCVVQGTKTASPARIRLGETVQIRLSLSAKCPPAQYRSADLMVMIDSSLSMTSGGKLQAAQTAAHRFVDQLDFSLQRMAVLGFYGSARLVIGLSSDPVAINAAIANLPIDRGTDIANAIDVAQEELTRNGRPDARPVMILITDGAPNEPASGPEQAALLSANAAKVAGTTIYTIGLGSGAAETLLKQIASGPEYYFFAPGNSQLAAIYDQIALVVGNFTVRNVGLGDDLGVNGPYVAGSGAPAPAVASDVLNWTVDALSEAPIELVYEIKPTKVGTYLAADRTVAHYLDLDGQTRDYVFEQPSIEVLDPPNTRACGDGRPWSINVHSFPDSVGVSSVRPQGCNIRFDSGDWATGTAYRLPLLEYVLTDGSGTKELFRGSAVQGSGRVDEYIPIRVCQPPPYKLRLVTTELAGYQLCPNAWRERTITLRDFRPVNFRNTLERFGFFR